MHAICLTAAESTEYLLDKAAVTIGRGASCDIRIGTHYVSREHAKLTITESGCFIEDLGSRNGVFVNAVKVERLPFVEVGSGVDRGDRRDRRFWPRDTHQHPQAGWSQSE